MHLGKFHSAVADLVFDFTVREIASRIQNLINHLDSLASNPGNAEIAAAFKQLMIELKATLSKSALNTPHPTLSAMFASIKASKYVGGQLYQRIEDVTQQNGMTPQIAAAKLRELLSETTTYYAHLDAIEKAFEALQVEYEDIGAGEGELAISIPEPATPRLLSDLAATAKAWNTALYPFVELADPEHNPVEVRTISSSDWQFYLSAAPEVLLVISTVVAQINELLSQLVTTKKLIEQLRSSGMSAEATSGVSAEADRRLDTRSREIAEHLVDNNPPPDHGRANELKISITRSVKFMAKEMAENVTIEVRYLPPAKLEGVDTDATELAKLEILTAAAEKITSNMAFLPLDSNVSKILNLPAPADVGDND